MTKFKNIELTVKELSIIISSTYMQYQNENEHSLFREDIKNIHKKLSKYVNDYGYTINASIKEDEQ